MNNIIAVFNSRSETLSFANILRRYNIPATIVQTPKEAGRACGISVKFAYNNFQDAKDILNNMRFQTFNGFYLENSIGGPRSALRG